MSNPDKAREISENNEINSREYYTVTLEFKGQQAKTPRDAAEEIATYLVDHANQLIFTVMDSVGNSVDIDLDVGE